jgi:hypothetical protein
MGFDEFVGPHGRAGPTIIPLIRKAHTVRQGKGADIISFHPANTGFEIKGSICSGEINFNMI